VAVEDMVAAVGTVVVASTAAAVSMVAVVFTVEAFTVAVRMSAASMEAAAMSADFMAEDFMAAAFTPLAARRGQRTARVTSKPGPRKSARLESAPPKCTPLKFTRRQTAMRDFHKARPPAGTPPQTVQFSATPTL
jgi:hypothetical protein